MNMFVNLLSSSPLWLVKDARMKKLREMMASVIEVISYITIYNCDNFDREKSLQMFYILNNHAVKAIFVLSNNWNMTKWITFILVGTLSKDYSQ